MSNIPNLFSKYFWDTDFSSIDISVHQQYIIARLLRLGDETALKWLHQTYNHEDIKKCVHESRELSDKDKNFFQLFY